MHKLIKTIVLVILFFNFSSQAKPVITKTQANCLSVGATVLSSAALTYIAYKYMKKRINDCNEQEDINSENCDLSESTRSDNNKTTLKLFGFSAFFTTLFSVLFYKTFYSYTHDGYFKEIKEESDDLDQLLNSKFGECLFAQDLDEKSVLGKINLNFGKKTLCPLVEAEIFVRNCAAKLNRYDKLAKELASNEQLDSIKNKANIISERLANVLLSLQKNNSYDSQLRRYESFMAKKYNKHKDDKDRRAGVTKEFARLWFLLKGVKSIKACFTG